MKQVGKEDIWDMDVLLYFYVEKKCYKEDKLSKIGNSKD